MEAEEEGAQEAEPAAADPEGVANPDSPLDPLNVENENPSEAD